MCYVMHCSSELYATQENIAEILWIVTSGKLDCILCNKYFEDSIDLFFISLSKHPGFDFVDGVLECYRKLLVSLILNVGFVFCFSVEVEPGQLLFQLNKTEYFWHTVLVLYGEMEVHTLEVTLVWMSLQ